MVSAYTPDPASPLWPLLPLKVLSTMMAPPYSASALDVHAAAVAVQGGVVLDDGVVQAHAFGPDPAAFACLVVRDGAVQDDGPGLQPTATRYGFVVADGAVFDEAGGVIYPTAILSSLIVLDEGRAHPQARVVKANATPIFRALVVADGAILDLERSVLGINAAPVAIAFVVRDPGPLVEDQSPNFVVDSPAIAIRVCKNIALDKLALMRVTA